MSDTQKSPDCALLPGSAWTQHSRDLVTGEAQAAPLAAASRLQSNDDGVYMPTADGKHTEQVILMVVLYTTPKVLKHEEHHDVVSYGDTMAIANDLVQHLCTASQNGAKFGFEVGEMDSLLFGGCDSETDGC